MFILLEDVNKSSIKVNRKSLCDTSYQNLVTTLLKINEKNKNSTKKLEF